MNKLVYKYDTIEEKILSGVDKIADPIRCTMSPKGSNVLYEDSKGNQYYTNDGATIAKSISLKDPIENAVVEVIKSSSQKTNIEAGDGTSSTVLMSSVLIKEGLKLKRIGWNARDIINEFNNFGTQLKSIISETALQINGAEDIKKIARVSSSNDEEIADNVAEIIETAGMEGQVIINLSYAPETKIVKDTGFVLMQGLLGPELLRDNKMNVSYENVPIFITDKRLYYKQEAEALLKTCLDNGHRTVVIVAQDFIGDALPYFIANHSKGVMNILLVKETNKDILEDLAVYVGGKKIQDSDGSFVDHLTFNDFALVKMAFADQFKTIISRVSELPKDAIDTRVESLKSRMDEIGDRNNKEYTDLEKRISSLTRGMVTVNVGGRTPIEASEKSLRYEDAIHAVRAAMDKGYVVGGGLSIYNAGRQVNTDDMPTEIRNVFKTYTEAIISQVAENCGLSPDVTKNEICAIQYENGSHWGYNAVTEVYENLMESGIIEPLKVITQVIDNSISIAGIIINSKYFILHDVEEDKEK